MLEALRSDRKGSRAPRGCTHIGRAGELSLSIMEKSLTIIPPPQNRTRKTGLVRILGWPQGTRSGGKYPPAQGKCIHGALRMASLDGLAQGFEGCPWKIRTAKGLEAACPGNMTADEGAALTCHPCYAQLVSLSHLWQPGYTLHFWSKATHFLLLYTAVPTGHPKALRAVKWLMLYHDRRIGYVTLNIQTDADRRNQSFST